MDYLGYGDKGERVRKLQHLLNYNSYYHPKRRIVEDGDFGPLTSALIQRTKYWLGYEKGDLRPIAGEEIHGYLTEKIPLPGDYRSRRKLRIEKRDKNREEQDSIDHLRLEALDIIRGELGTLEQPNNSNHIKYNDFWGWGNVPYCVIGISWAWLKAGSKAFSRGNKWAGCREMLADARAGNNIHLTSEPEPGCPGVIDFTGDASPDHAITFVRDNNNGTCQTIEFNTSKDNTYIQGVFNKTRRMADCWWLEPEK